MIEWTFLLAGTVELVLPLSVTVYIWKKFSSSWVVFVLGSVVFLGSLARIPLNLVVQNSLENHCSGSALLVTGAFFLSVTVGLFEEGFRFLGYKYLFRKDKRDWKHGLLYGAGHGATEAVVMAASGHLLMGLLLMSAPGLLPSQVAAEISTTPVYMPLLEAIERAFILCVQIGLSVLVLQCFSRNSLQYLWYAVALHTAAVFMVAVAEQAVVVEAAVGVCAVVSLYVIWNFRDSPPRSCEIQKHF
jgi:uncharacterized membrane protein YhfC